MRSTLGLLAAWREETERELKHQAGVAALQAADRNVDDLVQRADAALYKAKAGGRGRLVESPSETKQGELTFDLPL